MGVIDKRPTNEENGTIYHPTDVQHGYTYKVTASNIITTNGILIDGEDKLTEYNTRNNKSERFALIGDLLIADVQEKDSNGNYLNPPILKKWDYVPSGDD
jgi:DNA polymerase sigma